MWLQYGWGHHPPHADHPDHDYGWVFDPGTDPDFYLDWAAAAAAVFLMASGFSDPGQLHLQYQQAL